MQLYAKVFIYLHWLECEIVNQEDCDLNPLSAISKLPIQVASALTKLCR